MMFDVKVNAQFQPRSASDVLAVVLANRKTPVITTMAGDVETIEPRRVLILTSGDGKTAPTTHVRNLDHVSCKQCAWNSYHTKYDLLHTTISLIRMIFTPP